MILKSHIINFLPLRSRMILSSVESDMFSSPDTIAVTTKCRTDITVVKFGHLPHATE